MNERLPLSVAIITLNEENALPRCLESVRNLATEVVIVDSGSTDRTRDVAARFGAILETHSWQGHVAQKNIALRRCTQPWVLCLDADEALSPALATSIKNLFMKGQPAENGFEVNRLSFYLGEWIRHSWNPEWRLRLVRRSAAEWQGLDPHDKLEVQGQTRRLDGNLLHWPFDSLKHHLEKSVVYGRIMAESYLQAGQSFHWYQMVLSPWLAFLKVLLIKGGWRDGWRGWVIAGAKWVNTFAKYAFLLEHRWIESSKRQARTNS